MINFVTMVPVNMIVRERPRPATKAVKAAADAFWKDGAFLLMVAGKLTVFPFVLGLSNVFQACSSSSGVYSLRSTL